MDNCLGCGAETDNDRAYCFRCRPSTCRQAGKHRGRKAMAPERISFLSAWNDYIDDDLADDDEMLDKRF